MNDRHQLTCPIADFLNMFGDPWTLLIMREAFYGATRFTEIQRNIGVARNLLSERLSRLVEEGILEREDVGVAGPRYAYHLTKKGQSLATVFIAMVQWSNEHLRKRGDETVHLIERKTGRKLKKVELLGSDGRKLKWNGIAALPGPGADEVARDRMEKAILAALAS